MNDFKMFNKQFYIDKINKEITEAQIEIGVNTDKIHSMPKLPTLKEGTPEYISNKKTKDRLYRRNATLWTKIKRLYSELDRYERLDI